MKRILAFVFLALALCMGAHAVYEPEADYMRIMMDCVLCGDGERGLEAEKLRNEKIALLKLDYKNVAYEELEMLAKIIEAEAGSRWLSMEWKMAVGEVVLNRIASPEFPDTMKEVLEQPGQYYGKDSPYFAALRPSEESVEAAKRLLEGEKVICDPSVVFQANFVLGSGVHTVLHDPKLGYTYLCYSSYPELYYE